MKKTNLLLMVTLALGIVLASCSKDDEPVTPGPGNNTPTEDFIKVNSTTYKKADLDSIKVTVKNGDTLLMVYINEGFVEIGHEDIVENKTYTGFWVADGDSSVRIWSRLGWNVGDPNFFPDTQNGTYIIKKENGKRVSYFENILCKDHIVDKPYTISGRVTWP